MPSSSHPFHWKDEGKTDTRYLRKFLKADNKILEHKLMEISFPIYTFVRVDKVFLSPMIPIFHSR